jgi:thiol-disulfide isomerase/thioredoxin
MCDMKQRVAKGPVRSKCRAQRRLSNVRHDYANLKHWTTLCCFFSVLLVRNGTSFTFSCLDYRYSSSRIPSHQLGHLRKFSGMLQIRRLHESSSSSDQEVLLSSIINDTSALITPLDTTLPSASSFGDVVRRPISNAAFVNSPHLLDAPAALAIPSEERRLAEQIRSRNMVVAVLSVAFALGHFVWQYLHPIEPIQILYQLQQSSADIHVIGKNGKPTVIDFWAPWCENCKLSAATLQSLEEQYGKDVNFVLINGDLAANGEYVDALGVDAIPHMAFISYDGVVETALIGPVPKRVVQADIEVLLENERNRAVAISPAESSATFTSRPSHVELPFQMLDVFAGKPDSARRIHFETSPSG